MRAILLLILISATETSFTQIIGTTRLFQLHKDFKAVEDSIAKRINLHNSIIYKTCEGNESFFLLQENSHWTGYYIKTLQVDELYLPPIIDTLKNGNIVTFEPYHTELLIFNADSIVNLLFKNHINKIQQISEDSIQAKLIKRGKKKNEVIVQTLPRSSHDCNSTIHIYGEKNISVTYRWSLVESEIRFIIPTLKIFYVAKQILINSTKNHSR
jgi:hypothetical protein